MNTPLQAYITKIESSDDFCVKIRFETQEITPAQSTELWELRGALGWLFFQEAPLDELANIRIEDLPELKLEKGEKSQATRLRAVLYRLWEQGERKINSEQHYREQMEKVIEHIKSKLV